MDIEKQVQENLKTIDAVDKLPSVTLDIRCVFDIGSQTIGPGGLNGRYLRQCKNAVLSGVQGSQLCRTHVKRVVKIDTIKNITHHALRTNRQIRLSRKDPILTDPAKLLLSINDWNAIKFKRCDPKLDKSQYLDKTATYGLEDSMCLAPPIWDEELWKKAMKKIEVQLKTKRP